MNMIEKMLRRDPASAAAISKLIQDPKAFGGRRATETQAGLAYQKMLQISQQYQRRLESNDDIFQMFPDMEMVVQLMISCVASPKDMMTTELIFSSEFEMISEKTRMAVLEIVKTAINGHYKLKDDLYQILRDALFLKGSHIKMVIPESSLDDIIAGRSELTTESVSRVFDNDFKPVGLGFLGNPVAEKNTVLALESFLRGSNGYSEHQVKLKDADVEHDLGVEIVDNYDLLKMPQVMTEAAKRRSQEIFEKTTRKTHIFTEAATRDIYRKARSKVKDFVKVSTSDQSSRRNIGRPLYLAIPPDSCIPIYSPGSETEHNAYIILIDQNGNFLSRHSNTTNENVISSSFASATSDGGSTGFYGAGSTDLTSSLIRRSKMNISDNSFVPTIDNICTLYGSIMDSEFEKRINSGGRAGKIMLPHDDSTYRMLLARKLQGQLTRMLYVPAELITYYAYNYHQNGIGKSFIDDMRALMGFRASLQIARIMGQMKNSINITTGNIKFDPDDPDPIQTIEKAQSIAAIGRSGVLVPGISRISDLVDLTHQAGMEWTYEGHPELPETSVTYESRANNHVVPDDSLDEQLRRQTYLACGVVPEMVDNSFGQEFATTVVSQNLLMSKRVELIQRVFSGLLTKNTKMLLTNDPVIRDALVECLRTDIDSIKTRVSDDLQELSASNEVALIEAVADELIESIVVSLPRPDVSSLTSQKEAFEEYIEAMEKAIEYWISADVVSSDMAGDVANSIDTIKKQILAYFARNWMSENGYLTELSEMVARDDEGMPMMDLAAILKEHTEGLMSGSLHYLASMVAAKNASNKDMEQINNGQDPSATPADESNTTDETTDDVSEFDMGVDVDPNADPDEEATTDTDTETPSEEPPTDDGETTEEENKE